MSSTESFIDLELCLCISTLTVSVYSLQFVKVFLLFPVKQTLVSDFGDCLTLTLAIVQKLAKNYSKDLILQQILISNKIILKRKSKNQIKQQNSIDNSVFRVIIKPLKTSYFK